MKERLTLLGAIDPYVGSYYSRAWIQREVLRMNDDDIKEMDKEIEVEKTEGIGLPSAVTTQVAQQQMMGQVDAENQIATQTAMAKIPQPPVQGQQGGGSSKPESKSASKPKSKTESKGDLTLENLSEDSSFTRLKRIL